MSGGVTLEYALQRVESSSIKERAEGLKDLKHVLRSNSRYDTLSDISFHRIYEVLFGIAVTEQSLYLKAKTPTTRSAADNRLSACASALRLAIELGARFVRLKTVRSVLDHISGTLALPNGGFCEPLALDYAKSLRFLLSYQPHVEHLSEDERERAASFCVDCIQIAQSELSDDDGAGPGAELASTTTTTNGLSYRSSRSHLNQSGGSHGSRSLAKQMAEEMVICLARLTAAPNAAPGDKASDLLSALLSLLQSSTVAGSSRQDAFAAINHILAWIRTDDIELTRSMASPLVRLIRQYWGLKTSFDKALAALRDEMLITLIHLRPYIFSALSQNKDVTLRSELGGLLDVLVNEYGQRSERDQLRLDDIRLGSHDLQSVSEGEINTALFRLRSGNPRAESSWAILYILASICKVLTSEEANATSSDGSDDDEEIYSRPRKRQRMTEEFNEILQASASGTVTGRVCALQTFTFLAQQSAFRPKQMMKVIDKLSTSCTDDNVLISSWAMIAVGSYASQADAGESSLSSRWLSIWQISVRAMSNASTCRAACYVIQLICDAQLVPQQHVTELVQMMTTSLDLNGPTVLADSVTNLLVFATHASQQINPASANATAETILGWLLRNFRPSKFADREYASQHSLLDPGHIMNLVSCCIGQRIAGLQHPKFPVWDSVGQILLECSQQQDLVDYLLLLPGTALNPHISVRQQDHRKPTAPYLSRPGCETLVLSHFIAELQVAQEEWNQLVRDRPQSMSIDAFISHCRSCLVATCIAFGHSFRDSRRQIQLQERAKEVLQTLSDFIPNPQCPQDKVDAMLATFSTACTGLSRRHDLTDQSKPEQHICQTVSRALANRAASRGLNELNDARDDMDMDDVDESQASRQSNSSVETYELKKESAARFSTAALRAAMATYTMAVKAKYTSSRGREGVIETPSTILTDYILSLSETSIILSRGVISSLSDIGVELTAEDCYQLMEYLADRILELYTYERSEVALIAVLDIMSSFAPLLTDESNKRLYDLGIDMYNWYTSVIRRAGVLSPNVQKTVASLLLKLCHVDTDYGRDDDQNVPSVRTSLFKLVELGSITVKYFLATRISTIFGLFVLSNHAAMFDDLQHSLPEDPDFLEGMAMRLLFLAKLASAWHSLLRQCVYYIFETAGRVKDSGRHAGRNMAELAAALKFSTPQKLFQLFAPQLLYTWLQNNPVDSLPFTVFQFDSLKTLIEHNQGEITAQLLVGGHESGMEVVQYALKSNAKTLLVKNFAKCQAYCLGWDIAHSSSNANDASCESRLRVLVGGKEEHRLLIANNFSAIMGQLYISSQQEDPQDGWLGKRSSFSAASKVLIEIKAFSHSDRSVPTSQEPCFKSKYLCDELERLCRRTTLDPVMPWEPSSFSLAARMMIDSLDTALGPLHNCLIIRKLRLLIAMAGDVTFSGFPLEMLLHTLRPFLADSQCADDVIGIVQYLLHRGQQYLQTNVPFLYGTIILMVLQMQEYSMAIPESTTQESQHKSTVQRMQNFQSWSVSYLKKYESTSTLPNKATYTSITATLTAIRLPGNARKGSPESSLLIRLLDGNTASEEIIRESDRMEALLILSENFETASSTAEDCLEQDDDCVRLAQSLMNALQIPGINESFKTWAANALGRAYAASGSRPLMKANDDYWDGQLSHYEGVARSQATIAKRLYETLFSRQRAEASLADHTLRSILASFRENDEAIVFQQILPQPILTAMLGGSQGYEPFHISSPISRADSLRQLLEPSYDTSVESWAQSVSLVLCSQASDMAVLPALKVLLQNSAQLALEFLPCIFHILLVAELEHQPALRTELSSAAAAHLSQSDGRFLSKQQFFIEFLVYLREQPVPNERTHSDRLKWLDVDWLVASSAAQKCGMSTAALLFAESSSSPTNGGKRASMRASLSQIAVTQVPQELLLSIYKSVEEPDSFYGVEQSPTLDSVLGRLDYEADGYRSLMFRSAQTDTRLRSTHELSFKDSAGIVRSLSMLNLNSLTFSLLTGGFGSPSTGEELLNAARRLQQWDIVPPYDSNGASANAFSAFQELSRASDRQTAHSRLQQVVQKHMQPLWSDGRTKKLPHEWFCVLASLTEVGEILSCTGETSLQSRWNQMLERQSWMSKGRYDHFQTLLSNRHTLFSVISKNNPLLNDVQLGAKQCRLFETMALLEVSRVAREHGQLQEALAATNQCNSLLEDGTLRVEVSVRIETSSVLWDLGEEATSVNMLQKAYTMSEVEHQDIAVGRSGLLAQLARQLAQARLEKPDDILTKYLKPAIAQLQDQKTGKEAGQVFHEFATFCDKQLQNPSTVEDLNRITKMRQRKAQELQELQRVAKSTSKSDPEGKEHRYVMSKAQQWYEIDNAEYKRLKRNRDTFMEQSIQNYLLALAASDEYDLSILRFFTLWFEHVDVVNANSIVAKLLPRVPSWKFVVLVNQLTSRLEQDASAFQASLKALVTRICSEHPHHSLHHLFTSTRRPSSKDPSWISRYHVATEIAQHVKKEGKSADLLDRIFQADTLYHALANKEIPKGPSRIQMKDILEAYHLAKKVPTLHVPPPTMNVTLQPDGNYKHIPEITKFSGTLGFMSGQSRPKKVVAYASNGEPYVQLFKGPPGKDDLRQDAIMEQVFGEVSKMLQNHEATQRRNLHVRTYKVVPLSNQTGIIEFVPNSISLNDYLVPAHERYHPQDYKNRTAREKIDQASHHSTETRVKEYLKVCDHLHPVLRHFFFERYKDPNEWFEKRTAYTRTTATISILGYVLGLGDRHCQNIMLDEKTGEVVHIDLGVAFEAGRVLPIPELVPFRLSRDVVDGMGITKTEGVFRRCCEFTMDALWEDKDSIMTLLNVLRYDPLYTWTVSPLRAKRMQEEAGRNVADADAAEGSSRKKEQEAGEADRALSVVEKKLSKTLSTAATVNELIQRATDVRNLATLFSGWSAYY